METPEEKQPGEEMAELEAELDAEISDAERMIDSIMQPDPVLQSLLGPDAEPKALDDFAEEDFGEADAEREEWTSPDSRWPIENRLDEHDGRLAMLENPDPEPEIIRETPDRPRLVLVYQSGGSAGTYSATCSYTYELRELDGESVIDDTDGTPISPQKARIPNCVYTAAPDGSYGLAAWDGETLVLLEAYGEYPTTQATVVIEDVNYDTTSHKLEYNWRNARVLARDTLDEDGDADNLVTEAAPCP